MMASASVRFRVALLILASTLSLAVMTGCSGGWGDAKPEVTVSKGTSTPAVTVGQSATFSVTPAGTGPFTYQWYVNGVAITGANASSYTTGATTGSENGSVYTVVVTNAGGGSTSTPFVLTVNTPPAISASPASQTVTVGQSATFTVSAAGTAPFSYQWYLNGAPISGATSSSYTTAATTTLGSSAYTVQVTNVAGTVTSAAGTLTVNPIVPTLVFAPIGSETYGGAAFPVSATSASSGAVTYAVVSGPATVAGNMVTLTGTGTVVLSASQAASGNYAAAAASTTFAVSTEVPTLTFGAIGSKVYGTAPFTVSATSASSGAITYAVVSGPATVTPTGTVTITGAGPVVLSASQAASGNYAAATGTTTFTVGTEVPALTIAPIGTETFGGAPFTVSATSPSSAPITYTWVSGPATVTSSGTVTITGAGPVVLTANEVASGNYAAASPTPITFTVQPEVPTLTVAPIGTETFGGAPFTVSATSPSSAPIIYTWVSGPATVTSSGTVTITGAGPVVLDANQAASGNYAAATTTPITFTVAKEVPTLTVGPIGTETFGGAQFTVSATSPSSGLITYTWVSGPATVTSTGTVTITGAGPVVLAANQAASGNYAAANPTPITFTVQPEVPTLTVAPIGTQTVGTPFTVSATTNSTGAISYTVAAGTGSATISNSVVSPTAAGTIVVSATVAATTNYTSATVNAIVTVNSVPVATSLTGSPASVLYGGNLSLVPVFSGGTAVIGTAGPGSSNITASAVTGASYPAPPVTAPTTYTLTVTGTGGNSVSTTYTATPTGNVTITAVTPANTTMGTGQQTFSAAASGGATDGLTWSASGGSITQSGAWTAPNTSGVYNPGTYTITATSADEPSVYVSTTVTVTKPVITLQPISKNACSGQTINPSLTMAANYATSYQWNQNGSPLSGDTSPTLSLGENLVNGTYSYSCTATNEAGTANTNTVTVNVVTSTPLTITTQPAAASVYVTQAATFAVGATGTGTLTYQWYTNTSASTTGGTPISGATSSSYTTGALGTENNGTYYYVTVTDADCTGTTLTSNPVELSVSDVDTAVPPTIIVEPIGETATVGGTATFSVTASGSGTLSYQWYRVPYSSTELTAPSAGTPISGATSSTYTVPSTETNQTNDGDNYYVMVTGGSGSTVYGSAVSSRVTLAVGAGIQLQITSEPQTDYVGADTLASFSVGATCTGCVPVYQWYWYAPKSTQAVALTDGPVATGALANATVVGSGTSSLTLENAPTTATGGIVYAVVTSTNGTTQIAGTNPLTSSTAGLFVGSLGSIGDATPGYGLCNAGNNWVLNGQTSHDGGTTFQASGGVSTSGSESTIGIPYQVTTGSCTIEMVDDNLWEQSAVYWPNLISTANFSVSFTVTISSTGTPADGFTMILADPSQGATTASTGTPGEGIGARDIPGFVLGFDTYQDGDTETSGDSPTCWYSTNPDVACDPVTVPYMAVGQGADALWENPWTFVNGNLDTQASTDYSASTYANSTHNYVVTVVNGVMTVTMDTYELFSGKVSLPPAAYLGFTASTGGADEAVTFSNLTATVSAP